MDRVGQAARLARERTARPPHLPAGCAATRVPVSKVRQGLEHDDWKPMKSVGQGVREIRIQTAPAHRVFYLATFDEAVYVLHAFEQKTQKTSPHDVTLARDRYRALLKKRVEDAEKE
ncbi:MAG: type II toxin-antitoxin system RelE/ParE family toxin [Acidobacteriota bacterium]